MKALAKCYSCEFYSPASKAGVGAAGSGPINLTTDWSASIRLIPQGRGKALQGASQATPLCVSPEPTLQLVLGEYLLNDW